MRRINVKKAIVTSFVGLFALVGVSIANGQDLTEEYREWQRAQQRAQREYIEYQRTRSPRDYRQWQRAQQNAQREYLEYQRAQNNNRYYNNGYYNPGVTVSYGVTPARTYRYYRNGRYYTVDYRGAELLRQAVNRGYQQGYLEGQRDRRYGRRYNYYDSNLYRSGTYGYQSFVARDQYQYYFQQGFQRGYQDGFNSTTRYGYRQGNTFNILGTVLGTILNLAADND